VKVGALVVDQVPVRLRKGRESSDVFGGGVKDSGLAAVGAVEGDREDACLPVSDGRGFNRQMNVGVAYTAPGLLSPWLMDITGNIRA
jgi:hypothetical protein